MRWKLRIAISQLNILHPTVFVPITFKNKTTHFVQPKNSYSVQTANRAKIPLHDLAIFAGWAHAIFGARVPA